MDTTSETKTVRELFRGEKFTVPEVQRDYAWDAKVEVSKLLEDIWKYHATEDKEATPLYFIGTVIVYQQEVGGALQIMDGQQRISSLTCLFAAIKTIFEKASRDSESSAERNRLERIAEKIEDDFLFELENGTKPIFKLRPKSRPAQMVIREMTQMDGKIHLRHSKI